MISMLFSNIDVKLAKKRNNYYIDM